MNIFRNTNQMLSGPFDLTLRTGGEVEIWESASPTTVDLRYMIEGHIHVEFEPEALRCLSPWIILKGDIVHLPFRNFENIAAIHRRLASVAPTPEGYANFAKKFGILGLKVYYLHKSASPGYWYSMVSFYDWLDFAQATKFLVGAMDLARSVNAGPKSTEVRTFAESVENSLRLFPPNLPAETGSISQAVGKGILGVLHSSPAKIAHGLESLIEEWLSFFMQKWATPAIERGNRWNLFIKSDFVTGAVTTALVNELSGESGLPRKCGGCGEWFMADHGKQKHCSESCKTKAYRRRRMAKREEANV